MKQVVNLSIVVLVLLVIGAIGIAGTYKAAELGQNFFRQVVPDASEVSQGCKVVYQAAIRINYVYGLWNLLASRIATHYDDQSLADKFYARYLHSLQTESSLRLGAILCVSIATTGVILENLYTQTPTNSSQ